MSIIRSNSWQDLNGVPYGTVLRVLQAVKTDTFSTANFTMVDVPGLSITLTPKSASSKFLVQWRVNCSNTYYASYLNVTRNGTPLLIGDAAGARPTVTSVIVTEVTQSNAHGITHFHTGNFVDAPATTSSLTYKIMVSGRAAGEGYTGVTSVNRSTPDRNTVEFDGRHASTLIVTEIAA